MKPLNGRERYREVYSDEKAFTFDEEYLPDNINTIFRQYGYKVFEDDYSANLMRRPVDFRLTRFDKVSKNYLCEFKNANFFVFDHGILKRYYKKFGRLVESEYMYIHFQGRKMENYLKETNMHKYKIATNRFIDLEVSAVTEDNFKDIRKIYSNNHRRKLFKNEIIFWGKKISEKIEKIKLKIKK